MSVLTPETVQYAETDELSQLLFDAEESSNWLTETNSPLYIAALEEIKIRAGVTTK